MKDKKLKLPGDVVGTLRALLQTPPMPKPKVKQARKPKRKAKR